MEIAFRYKPKGWRERYIYTTDGENTTCFHQSKDLYFRMFELGHCYLSACYECRWRDASAADLRIGDYWENKFAKDKTGVSMVVAMTSIGAKLLADIDNTNCADIQCQPVEDYYKCQQSINLHQPVFYDALIESLANDYMQLEEIVDVYAKPLEKRIKISKQIHKVKKIIKR